MELPEYEVRGMYGGMSMEGGGMLSELSQRGYSRSMDRSQQDGSELNLCTCGHAQEEGTVRPALHCEGRSPGRPSRALRGTAVVSDSQDTAGASQIHSGARGSASAATTPLPGQDRELAVLVVALLGLTLRAVLA
jgi:hypothetical protein